MKDLIDKAHLFLDTKIVETSGYRRSLYSKVVYEGYHKETAQGHVIIVTQYRKDFYRPKAFVKNQEDFFGMNQMLREMRMQAVVDKAEDEIKNLVTQLKILVDEGFVLNHYPIKEIKALQFVQQSQLEYLDELKVKDIPVLPGHIRAIRHSKPQYEGHKALETSNGQVFYYRTSWSPVFKEDLNFSNLQQEIKFESDDLVEQQQGEYNAVSCPDEEPLIISEV